MVFRALSVAVFVTALTWMSSAHAAGWTQPEGGFYAKVWDRTLLADTVFITQRSTAGVPRSFFDHQLNLYGEYGITDDWTLTLNAVPYGYAGIGGQRGAYTGGGSVGARYRLTRGRISSAIEVQAGGRPDSRVLATGLVRNPVVSPLGERSFIAQPVVGTGYGSIEGQVGFGLDFFWLSALTGIRGFTNYDELKPAVYIGGQVGWITDFGLVADLHMNWFHSTGSVDVLNIFGAGQTRYLGWGLGLSYWFSDRFAINAGIDGAFFATANASTPALTFGVEFK